MENMVDKKNSKNFWKSKKVLITGHTGFKGAWLSFILNSKGAEVIGFALPPHTKPSIFETLKLPEKITSIYGDIRDLGHITSVINKYKPEILIHIAAQPLVKKSYKEPLATFQTNAMGTVNMLEAIRLTNSVKTGVFITSDKCYANNDATQSFNENDRLGGIDPYSSSKACAELIIYSYRNSFFKDKIHIASTRAGNVIGGGDWSDDRIIPDIVKALYENKKLSIRNPQAVRPWQHVLEPLSGYILLAEKLHAHGDKYAQAWNFGPANTNPFPVSEIVKEAVKTSGNKLNINLSTEHHPHEAGFLMLDSSKAKKELLWSPRLNTQEAIKWTMEWYDAYYNNKDMNQFTLHQIQEYEKKPKK